MDGLNPTTTSPGGNVQTEHMATINGVKTDTVSTGFVAEPLYVTATSNGFDLRTSSQHIAAVESQVESLRQHVTAQDAEIARLQQRIADQGMLLAQLREIIQGEPPFLQPVGNFHVNE